MPGVILISVVKFSIEGTFIYNVCFVSKKLYMVYRCITNIAASPCYCYISSAQDIIIFAEGIMFYLFRLAILFHLVQYLENFILCFRLYSKKINFKHIAEFMIFSMFWKLSAISHDCIDFMYEETSQRILGLFLFCFLWVYFDPSNSLC